MPLNPRTRSEITGASRDRSAPRIRRVLKLKSSAARMAFFGVLVALQNRLLVLLAAGGTYAVHGLAFPIAFFEALYKVTGWGFPKFVACKLILKSVRLQCRLAHLHKLNLKLAIRDLRVRNLAREIADKRSKLQVFKVAGDLRRTEKYLGFGCKTYSGLSSLEPTARELEGIIDSFYVKHGYVPPLVKEDAPATIGGNIAGGKQPTLTLVAGGVHSIFIPKKERGALAMTKQTPTNFYEALWDVLINLPPVRPRKRDVVRRKIRALLSSVRRWTGQRVHGESYLSLSDSVARELRLLEGLRFPDLKPVPQTALVRFQFSTDQRYSLPLNEGTRRFELPLCPSSGALPHVPASGRNARSSKQPARRTFLARLLSRVASALWGRGQQ